MTADTHASAGAYALDALPDDERAFFERHLQACESCQKDVEELLETAAALGAASYEPPPPALRERVLAAADTTRQLPPRELPGHRGRAGIVARLRPLLAPVAAALAVAVVVLGAVTADLNRRVNELDQVVAAERRDEVTTVLAADDVETVVLQGADGASLRLLHSPSLDRAILATDGLPDPGDRRTYELWLAHDGQMVPAGVFDPDPQGRSLTVVDGSVAGAELAAISVEPHGGSSQPTGPVVASEEL